MCLNQANVLLVDRVDCMVFVNIKFTIFNKHKNFKQPFSAPGVTCPDLPDPDNGIVEFNTRFGDTATYSCVRGFMPDREPVRTCGPDGQWSGVALACVCKCFNLALSPHAMFLHVTFELPTIAM